MVMLREVAPPVVTIATAVAVLVFPQKAVGPGEQEQGERVALHWRAGTGSPKSLG